MFNDNCIAHLDGMIPVFIGMEFYDSKMGKTYVVAGAMLNYLMKTSTDENDQDSVSQIVELNEK